MSGAIRITFDRLPEIAAKLPQVTSTVVRKAAFDVEAQAKSELYEGHGVDTGLLKSSIQTDMEGDLRAIVAPHTEYASYVEFGHHSFTGYHYMTQAAEWVRPAFLEAMRRLEAMLR